MDDYGYMSVPTGILTILCLAISILAMAWVVG